jgi:hypothetical protein
MPKHSVNYNNTVIYKIVCRDLSVKDVYVGHTTDFKNRKNQHKTICNREKEDNISKKYDFIRNHGGWENWEMVEIEKYPCNDSNEATARERYYCELLNSTLNTNRPRGNTTNARQRHYDNNKQLYKERVRQQREEKKAKQENMQTPPTEIAITPTEITSPPQPVKNNQNNTREEYILNFYSTIKTEYNFMMWVRNIKRVHKALFNQETIQNERSEIKKQPADNSLIDCIRSLLKVGERYISLHSSPTNPNGVPIFFHIKQIEDEKILITYVNIRFLKCGDGKAMFIPEWENIIGDIVIYNKDLFNVRPFKERECYKHDSYLEIKKSVNAFYGIIKARY